jgi:hypothetical protein
MNEMAGRGATRELASPSTPQVPPPEAAAETPADQAAGPSGKENDR